MKHPSPISGTVVVSTRTELNQALKNLTFVAAVTTGSLGLATTMPVSEAQAFGLGDITGAAKKVGYVAKHGGKMAGGFVKDAAKGIKTANDVINYVPKAVQKGVRDTTLDAAGRAYGKFGSTLTKTYGKIRGIDDENYLRQTQEAADTSRDFISGFGKRIDGYVGAAKRKTRKVLTKGITSGESLPRVGKRQQAARVQPLAQTRAAKLDQGQTRKLGNVVRKGPSSVRPPVRGIRKDDLTRNIKHGNSGFVGRDKTFYAVPIDGKRPPVQGIKRRDLKNRIRHGKRPIIGHDKSVFGRPIYGKPRPGHGVKNSDRRKRGMKRFSKRRDNLRDRRSNTRKFGRKFDRRSDRKSGRKFDRRSDRKSGRKLDRRSDRRFKRNNKRRWM